MSKFKFPLRYWHLEISTKCALACPRCPRTNPENNGIFPVTELPSEYIQKVFTPRFLHQEVERILFCGGRGDPIYHTKFIDIVRHLKQAKPKLQLIIVTNGSYRKKEWWAELSSVLNEYDWVVFSVDGWDQESNQMYRVGSHFESIAQGIRELAKGKAILKWQTIAFKFNENQIDKIKATAKALGVHHFGITLSTKFGGKWNDSSGVDPLQPSPKFQSRFGRYEKYNEELNPIAIPPEFAEVEERIWNGIKNWKSEAGDVVVPRCMTGDRGLYLHVSGVIYPCGWLSHLGEAEMAASPGQKNIWKDHESELSIRNRSLEKILNSPLWQEFFATWKNQSQMFATCRSMCACKNTTHANTSRNVEMAPFNQ